MAKKNVTYRVFIIKNEELTHDATDLKDVLRTKLANSNVERRLIPVKEGDDSEKDLLGAFARIALLSCKNILLQMDQLGGLTVRIFTLGNDCMILITHDVFYPLL